MKKDLIFILSLFLISGLFAQEGYYCAGVTEKLENWEKRIEIIDISDPDKIPLHFLFVREVVTELQQFYKEDLPQVVECKNLNFNEIISRYDQLLLQSRFLFDTLEKQKEVIDELFYQSALEESYFKNWENCYYFVNRSLEYNPLNANSLLLKLELLYQDSIYVECLSHLERLYSKSQLTEEQEKKAMDFTAKFYDKLYSVGDSLVRIDKSAEALEIFQILEVFCLNMPSSYCNDDYYHGIIRSKTGVYESYLEIAKIARERKHYDIETRFIQYAQEYADANHEVLSQVVTLNPDAVTEISLPSESLDSVKIEPESRIEMDQIVIIEKKTQLESPKMKRKKSVSLAARRASESQIESEILVQNAALKPEKEDAFSQSNQIIDSVEKSNLDSVSLSQPEVITIEPSVPIVEDKTDAIEPIKLEVEEFEKLQEQYNQLVELGLDYCRKREYSKGVKVFQQAKDMEQNPHLERDGRVKIMLNALKGIE